MFAFAPLVPANANSSEIKVDSSFQPTGSRGTIFIIFAGDNLKGNWIHSYDPSPNPYFNVGGADTGIASPYQKSGSFLLDYCRKEFEVDCVESVQASQVPAEWFDLSVKYQPGVTKYEADKAIGSPNGAGVTIWKFPDSVKSPFDIKLSVGGSASVVNGKFGFDTFNVVADAVVDTPGDFHYAADGINLAGRTQERCRPFGYVVEGHCGKTYILPKDLKIRVAIRFAHPLSGWLAGRLANPLVETEDKSGYYKITVQGSAIDVPQLHASFDPALLPSEVSSKSCLGGCQLTNSSIPTSTIYRKTWGLEITNLLDQVLRPATRDTSSFVDRIWRMTWNDVTSWGPNVNRCSIAGTNVQGMLTTNATFYDAAPPTFDPQTGTLNYQVAGMHYLPDSSVFEGDYNLGIKKSTALCLFGLKDIPLAATVAVTGENGQTKTATSSLTESHGWIYFHVNGFNFSANAIKVKIQGKSPTEIICVKKSNKKITKKVVGANPKCPSGYIKK